MSDPLATSRLDLLAESVVLDSCLPIQARRWMWSLTLVMRAILLLGSR